MKCELWSVKYELWSVTYELWRMNCEVWTLKSFVSLSIYLTILETWKCEVWTVKYELWSVKSELWTMKSPPVLRSFVLNSLWTFVKDIWQDKRLQNPWLRLLNCSWSKLFEP